MNKIFSILKSLSLKKLVFFMILGVVLDTIIVVIASNLLFDINELKSVFKNLLSNISLNDLHICYFLLFLIFCRFFVLKWTMTMLDLKTMDLEQRIRENLINNYLIEKSKASNTTTAEFLSNSLMWSQLISINLFGPYIRLAADTTFILLVLGYSIYSSTKIAGTLILFCLIVFLFVFLKRKFFNAHKDREEIILLQEKVSQHSMDIINNKPLINMYPPALNTLRNPKFIRNYLKKRANLLTIARLPKLYVETGLFFVLTVIYALESTSEFSSLQKILSFEAFAPLFIALFRIAPSITGYIAFFSVYTELIEVLKKLLILMKDKFKSLPLTNKNEININQLSLKNFKKKYGKYKIIYKNTNPIFTFKKGRLNFIVGPSGSGKSTLLNCITGLEKKTSGTIFVNKKKFNKDLLTLSFLCPQEHSIISGDLNRNLSLFTNHYDEKKATELAKRLGLKSLINLKNLGKISLSGGQKQKIGIIRSLISNRQILFFDEPSSNLDQNSTNILRDILNEYINDKLLIIISHDASLKDNNSLILECN